MKLSNPLLLILLFFASCAKPDLPVSSIARKVDYPALNRVYVKAFIFGTTTGECFRNCMPRFKLTYEQGKFVLKLDNESRNIYDKNPRTYSIDLSKDTTKVRLARDILYAMPQQLVHYRGSGKRFGSCAPCYDATEVNIQIKWSNGRTKFFTINPRESLEQGVPREVSIYANFIIRNVRRVLLREWNPFIKYEELLESKQKIRD
ncbi:hypothetical protein BKI52_30895 [marine bacterium AO1-C]|nr:hypothetical protein BKI52_30895 [marine bacterium AO1-C]